MRPPNLNPPFRKQAPQLAVRNLVLDLHHQLKRSEMNSLTTLRTASQIINPFHHRPHLRSYWIEIHLPIGHWKLAAAATSKFRQTSFWGMLGTVEESTQASWSNKQQHQFKSSNLVKIHPCRKINLHTDPNRELYRNSLDKPWAILITNAELNLLRTQLTERRSSLGNLQALK